MNFVLIFLYLECLIFIVMTKISKILAKKVNPVSGKSEVLLRLRHGHNIALRAKTHLFISPKFFVGQRDGQDAPGEIVVKSRIPTPEIIQAKEVRNKIDDMCRLIEDLICSEKPNNITLDWLQNQVDRFIYGDSSSNVAEAPKVKSFFNHFDDYLALSQFSESRRKHFLVLYRALQRYSLFKKFEITFETFNSIILVDFESFLRNEHTFFMEEKKPSEKNNKQSTGALVPTKQYEAIFKQFPECRTPKPRGDNYVKGLLTILRTFIIWANKTGKTQNNPFKDRQIQECVYGTPIFITDEERNIIYETDFSYNKRLEQQRDIFIFQCLVGCRISDLYSFRHSNIITEKTSKGYRKCINYIPRKTKEGNPVTVSVPLNVLALEILKKYEYLRAEELAGNRDSEGEIKKPIKEKQKSSIADGPIFPFIAQQHYNEYIKEIFKACGITRIVSVINPTTGKIEQKSIADVASSHLARRTFIGNLYNKVQDPNLVGSLSGHKEGSRAFARYRTINIDIKADLIDKM
ncbi:MAG: integrase [Bacteroidetes bacterium HGW-Bacteroidetes-10]|nr:MAG: integrase [Bacteroidetes bacterium HGW-Bacteroidetes-10]